MSFAFPVRKTLQISSDFSLSYFEWGQGDEPILLLHGLADNALVWAKLGEALQNKYPHKYHIVALDLRGHGESAKPASGYKCDDYIEDFHALFSHLNWSSAHVLGHSWGGKVAAIWATREPESVRSLMLADPFFNYKIPQWWTLTFPIAYRVLPFLKLMGTFPSYEAAENIAKGLKQFRGWNKWQQTIFQASIQKNGDGTCESKFVKRACDEIFVDVMQEIGVSKDLEIPSLFIQPEKGLNRLELQFKPYRKHLKNLQWQIVSGNHWAHVIEPEAFNQVVLNFLSRITPQSEG